MPTISVIVPVYKVEAYLDRCVESILAQTFTDFELILVDDGSPDNCPAMCDAWAEKDSRIKVIHKQNGGLSDARNAGFATSCGEWISFIDSDDYVHPEMLQALYDAMQKFDVKVSACGFTRTAGEPLEESPDLSANLWSADEFYLQRSDNATVAWGKLYHRSVVLSYPVGKIHEDEFVTYRILFACEEIAVLDAALYGYYKNPQGITRNVWNSKRLDAIPAYVEQIAFFRKNGLEKLLKMRIRQFLEYMYWQEEIASAAGYMKQKQIKRWGRKILWMYRKDDVFSEDQDLWAYQRFYPMLTKIYLHFRSIGRKIRVRK